MQNRNWSNRNFNSVGSGNFIYRRSVLTSIIVFFAYIIRHIIWAIGRFLGIRIMRGAGYGRGMGMGRGRRPYGRR